MASPITSMVSNLQRYDEYIAYDYDDDSCDLSVWQNNEYDTCGSYHVGGSAGNLAVPLFGWMLIVLKKKKNPELFLWGRSYRGRNGIGHRTLYPIGLGKDALHRMWSGLVRRC